LDKPISLRRFDNTYYHLDTDTTNTMSGTVQQAGAKLEEVKQKVEAAAPAGTAEKLSGVALYSRFAFAGAVCCSLTHGGLTPVDV